MAEKAVLLVDDEAILLLSLKRSLRLRFGPSYRYETALSGEEGLVRIDELVAEEVEIVLVISDWLMPGMKGDEFLSRVHERHPSTRLVMLTGHADESDIAKLSGEVKLEAFLRKPWSPERLFEVVAAALS
jgi:response regulator RpfG family c-di-GMP phosphodiesterase